MRHLQRPTEEETPLRLSARNDVRELRLLLLRLQTQRQVVDERNYLIPETARTPLDISASRGSSVTSTHITGHRIPNPASWGNDRPLGFPQGGGEVTRCCGWPRSRRVRAGRSTSPQRHPDHGGYGPDSKTPSSPYLRVVQVWESLIGTPMPSAHPRVVHRTAKAITR